MAGDASLEPDELELPDGERAWYLFAVTGLVSIVIGVLVLAYPDPSLRLLGALLGIDLLIAAGALIVRGTTTLSPDGSGQNELLLGILALIAGVVVIRNPGETVTLLALALAIYMIVAGALALGRGLVTREQRAASLVKGLALCAAGTVIVTWPDLSADTFALLGGLALCLVGAADVGEAFVLRSRRRRLTGVSSGTPAPPR